MQKMLISLNEGDIQVINTDTLGFGIIAINNLVSNTKVINKGNITLGDSSDPNEQILECTLMKK